jgi:hypothetical protein
VVAFVGESIPALAQCLASLADSGFLQSKDVFFSLWSHPRVQVLCDVVVVVVAVVAVVYFVAASFVVVSAAFELWVEVFLFPL